MKILSKTKVLLIAFFCLYVRVAFSQGSGFIGSKNMFVVNLSSLAQLEVNAQYRLNIKKHQAVLIDFAHQNISNTTSYKIGGVKSQIGLKHTNYSFGVGFLMNNPKLNMPLPTGFYYGLKINRHWGKLNQSVQDSILHTYNHSSILPAIILGRGIVLSPKLVIDISVDAGFKFGQYALAEDVENGNSIEPLEIYPYNLPFVLSKPELKHSDGDTYNYRLLHCMPSIKLGFLF